MINEDGDKSEQKAGVTVGRACWRMLRMVEFVLAEGTPVLILYGSLLTSFSLWHMGMGLEKLKQKAPFSPWDWCFISCYLSTGRTFLCYVDHKGTDITGHMTETGQWDSFIVFASHEMQP